MRAACSGPSAGSLSLPVQARVQVSFLHVALARCASHLSQCRGIVGAVPEAVHAASNGHRSRPRARPRRASRRGGTSSRRMPTSPRGASSWPSTGTRPSPTGPAVVLPVVVAPAAVSRAHRAWHRGAPGSKRGAGLFERRDLLGARTAAERDTGGSSSGQSILDRYPLASDRRCLLSAPPERTRGADHRPDHESSSATRVGSIAWRRRCTLEEGLLSGSSRPASSCSTSSRLDRCVASVSRCM